MVSRDMTSFSAEDISREHLDWRFQKLCLACRAYCGDIWLTDWPAVTVMAEGVFFYPVLGFWHIMLESLRPACSRVIAVISSGGAQCRPKGNAKYRVEWQSLLKSERVSQGYFIVPWEAFYCPTENPAKAVKIRIIFKSTKLFSVWFFFPLLGFFLFLFTFLLRRIKYEIIPLGTILSCGMFHLQEAWFLNLIPTPHSIILVFITQRCDGYITLYTVCTCIHSVYSYTKLYNYYWI